MPWQKIVYQRLVIKILWITKKNKEIHSRSYYMVYCCIESDIKSMCVFFFLARDAYFIIMKPFLQSRDTIRNTNNKNLSFSHFPVPLSAVCSYTFGVTIPSNGRFMSISSHYWCTNTWIVISGAHYMQEVVTATFFWLPWKPSGAITYRITQTGLWTREFWCRLESWHTDIHGFMCFSSRI